MATEVVVTSRALERFESYIEQVGEHWLWTGRCDDNGYGLLVVPTKGGGWRHSYRAHRFAYLAYVGEIPPGLSVLHTCDTPPCVCPIHLYVGTQADNVRDMYERGRAGVVRLTDAERSAIVDAQGLHREIAARFGVSRTYVSLLKRQAV